MPRRLHVRSLRIGENPLDESESHHARDVLRLRAGDAVELFDDAGSVGGGVIVLCDPSDVVVRVDEVLARTSTSGVTIASAVPKGERGDWMIEKLSELGVDRVVPLRTARSVVHPSGKAKHDRWQRIALESAKQSRRGGVMQIAVLTNLDAVLAHFSPSPGTPGEARSSSPSPGTPGEGRGEGLRIFLSPEPTAPPLIELLTRLTSDVKSQIPIAQSQIANPNSQILLLIGPEGGWTDEEIVAMQRSGLTAARLTATILRVETAAVAAAAIACAWAAR